LRGDEVEDGFVERLIFSDEATFHILVFAGSNIKYNHFFIHLDISVTAFSPPH
jgi:hypothetical protein